jgi:amidase
MNAPLPLSGSLRAGADPADWPATRIAAAVASGAVSAAEVLDRHSARAEAWSSLGALVVPDWERAAARARALDEDRAAGRPLGPLAGVPFTVKDVLAVAGLRSAAGSKAFAANVPRWEATAVTRLVHAGAVLVGKTNCPELAFGTTCDSPLYGETGNPIAPGRSPGGSSGGESASVAAGISAVGLGSDFGGSLRWPAQCTGIVSLRPTPGRVPGTGQLPGAGGELGQGGPALPSPSSLQGNAQVVGPLARTVADLEAVMRVIAGPDGIDPRVCEVPLAPLASVDVGALRVGWSAGAHIGAVRAETAALVERASAALTAAGAAVTRLDAPFSGCLEAFNTLRDRDPLTDHQIAAAGAEDLLLPGSLAALERTAAADPRDRALAWGEALRARAGGLAVFVDVDVVLLPVAAGPACLPDGSLDVDGVRLEGWDLMAHCRAVSLLGTPVASVPVGLSAEGLPVSVQVIAAPWREDVALAVAASLADAGLYSMGGTR